jgi:hypothetical protein
MKTQPLFLLLLLLTVSACGPLKELEQVLDPDLIPPRLLRVRSIGETDVELCFDEQALAEPGDFTVRPELAVPAVACEPERLVLKTACQRPGERYILDAVVHDGRGNSLEFMAVFYGYNPEPPRLLINELSCRGTGNHPDVVEIKVLASGDMAAVTVYQGTPSSWQDRLIFPSFRVRAGEFILVHFKPEGGEEEIDETGDTTLSGGLDACETAYDFWIPEGTGISGNNGVVSVYARPGSEEILDGLLYSNRTSESDERYDGFGTSAVLLRARELVAHGGWRIAGEAVRPEDAVNPEGSTGTRTVCRDSCSTDTDSLNDWHIVPTLGATFGEDNSDEVYLP